jgi:hypothetical protein
MEHKSLMPEIGSLCFTYCQIPIVYRLSNDNYLEIEKSDGTVLRNNSLYLNEELSQQIFKRTGAISIITVYINESILK